MSKCLDCGREMHPFDAQYMERCYECAKKKGQRYIKRLHKCGAASLGVSDFMLFQAGGHRPFSDQKVVAR